MLNTEFHPWPAYDDEEVAAVGRVLKSNRVNYWTGTECREFESEFASATSSKHAIAVANGSLALELALRGLDIGPGDEVIVTPRSFLASASCVVNVGARPVFADVDQDSQNISAATVARVITPQSRAIIAVHLAGWPCELTELKQLASDHNLQLIEDCAQAHGATYRGQSVGAQGDVGCWSFCQDKIMTTGGEGGMVTTNDTETWRKMWSYKDHGKAWDAVYEREHPPGFRWLHESFGSNWRLTEMQAAIGRIQLRRLPEWTRQRSANATTLLECCRGIDSLRNPQLPAHMQHAWYKFYTFVVEQRLAKAWNRDRIIDEINAAGVPCYQGICPEVYLEKAFTGHVSRPPHRLPVARELGETSLMLLVHPTLTEAEIDKTARTVEAVTRRATRRVA